MGEQRDFHPPNHCGLWVREFSFFVDIRFIVFSGKN
jgi:hypothetical protein